MQHLPRSPEFSPVHLIGLPSSAVHPAEDFESEAFLKGIIQPQAVIAVDFRDVGLHDFAQFPQWQPREVVHPGIRQCTNETLFYPLADTGNRIGEDGRRGRRSGKPRKDAGSLAAGNGLISQSHTRFRSTDR